MEMSRLGTVPRMALAAAVVAAAACYPDEITDIDDLDTVTTLQDTLTNFGTALTYVIADTVIHVPIEDANIGHADDAALIARVKANMNAAGYTEIPDSPTANPDFYVNVAITTQQWVVIDWIGGCYYPWYGCWGWYYPTYPYVYSYETGTVLAIILDRRRADAGADRALEGIDQAFEQSPYLSRN
jgi:citrate lyase gamma subunit